MKKSPARRSLTHGLDVLARAARRGARGSRRIVLGVPSRALAKDEILIAVADTTSIALTRVKLPVRTAAGFHAEGPRLVKVARRIAEINMVADELAASAGGRAGAPPPFTHKEERLLRSGKLEPAPLAPGEAFLIHRATAEYARLLADSYSVEQAAAVLGVNGSRIRQRLTATPRSLFGIKLGKAWRIPKFQFYGARLTPGLDAVLSRIPTSLHPVAVHRWLTSPSPDLVAGAKSISPLDWLRIGNAPDIVADMAVSL